MFISHPYLSKHFESLSIQHRATQNRIHVVLLMYAIIYIPHSCVSSHWHEKKKKYYYILKHSKISTLQPLFTCNKLIEYYGQLQLVQVLYRDSGSSGVVKAIHSLHLEHEDGGAIEDDQQDQHRHNTHQGNMTEVALTVVGRSKVCLTECTFKLSLCD